MMAQAWGRAKSGKFKPHSRKFKGSRHTVCDARLFFLAILRARLGNRKKMLPENTTQPLKPDETIPVPSKTDLADIAHVTRRRIARRLLPFLFFLYIIAFLHPINVAPSALQSP